MKYDKFQVISMANCQNTKKEGYDIFYLKILFGPR